LPFSVTTSSLDDSSVVKSLSYSLCWALFPILNTPIANAMGRELSSIVVYHEVLWRPVILTWSILMSTDEQLSWV
jgi:hypothetical protein